MSSSAPELPTDFSRPAGDRDISLHLPTTGWSVDVAAAQSISAIGGGLIRCGIGVSSSSHSVSNGISRQEHHHVHRRMGAIGRSGQWVTPPRHFLLLEVGSGLGNVGILATPSGRWLQPIQRTVRTPPAGADRQTYQDACRCRDVAQHANLLRATRPAAAAPLRASLTNHLPPVDADRRASPGTRRSVRQSGPSRPRHLPPIVRLPTRARSSRGSSGPVQHFSR